ncbi:MAG: gas vesicle protein GVPa [Peptococcaceae bacterium BRH_c4a]|nr:MAG: gas vesicle protein GVPa [Peptococcaceae bacterium BRH_c4a]
MRVDPIKSTGNASLLDVVDRILDKGLVINADITVSLVGVELLGIKIKAAIASFETAAKYGLAFPVGTELSSSVVREASAEKETCPECGKKSKAEELLNIGCPWCGWISARARNGVKVPQP